MLATIKGVVVEHVEFEGAKGQMVCLLDPTAPEKYNFKDALRSFTRCQEPLRWTVKI